MPAAQTNMNKVGASISRPFRVKTNHISWTISAELGQQPNENLSKARFSGIGFSPEAKTAGTWTTIP